MKTFPCRPLSIPTTKLLMENYDKLMENIDHKIQQKMNKNMKFACKTQLK